MQEHRGYQWPWPKLIRWTNGNEHRWEWVKKPVQLEEKGVVGMEASKDLWDLAPGLLFSLFLHRLPIYCMLSCHQTQMTCNLLKTPLSLLSQGSRACYSLYPKSPSTFLYLTIPTFPSRLSSSSLSQEDFSNTHLSLKVLTSSPETNA